ncbi:MAG: hypothetical protein FWD16_07140 [Clostridia bacterium]|nr:hypothetical protein [Clostridia bacterium]
MSYSSAIIEAAKEQRRKTLAVDDTLSSLINMTDFSLSESTRRQLLGFHYAFFKEWDGNTQTQHQRGTVTRTGEIKWLLNNNGNIDPNPLEAGATTPFRSISEYDEDGTERQWMEKEFCITGMIRWHLGSRYRVKARGDGGSLATDSATPPPNDTNTWEKVLE